MGAYDMNSWSPGLDKADAYKVSGVPYLTGTYGSPLSAGTVQISFPYVTREITIINLATGSAPFNVGFSKAGVENQTNMLTLEYGASFTGDYRVTSLFISGSSMDFNIMAGLTRIPSTDIPTNWSGSQGIG